jgi:hypothetical protein
MSNSNRHRRSLLEKVSGPNAVPVAMLVARGEAASCKVQEKFDDFLKLRVGELERMLGALTKKDVSEALWKSFYTIVHDIRGSGALAGRPAVNSFCQSLERLLQERDPTDPRMGAAIASHINALNLVISEGAPDGTSQAVLMAELSRAVDCLPIRLRELRAV